ncbi:MAG TPA: HD domain-containing phosphohydrolase [Vicinamibacterales bacterium]|jgi:putative two-component system response regulator|nr:HD domain-containing phosphohydrolase [Vicinamibacterales bacterium]
MMDTPGRILVADDEPANVDLLERWLRRDGHIVFRASNGEEALAMVAAQQPDLVLLDVMMPKQTGFEVCQALKHDAATRFVPVVLVTALQNTEDRIRGIDAGADDFLTKPINPPELQARVRSLLRLKRQTDDLDSAESVIFSLALTIEARDAYTDGHCHRLSAYASALGEALGLPEEDLLALRTGGVIHDIGKVGVPDAILLKRGPLTADEFETMKLHTVIGDRLCGGLRSLKRVRPIVRHHHERLDGTGYPDHLRDGEIPLLAQIIGVVDVFDAVAEARPYKPAATLDHACRELEVEAVRGWKRAELVGSFIALIRDGRVQVGQTAVSVPPAS